jgi:predicted kinase
MGWVSRIAYVSGRLGAGKSSLAVPLAAELGYSLVMKDLIKETLHDALFMPGGEIDEAWSLRLGAASFELLWALAARAGDMVLEANFHPHSELELGRLRGLGDHVVEVYCACPAEVAVARYNARPPRHEVHWLKTATLAHMDRYDRPAGIGPLVTVDTTRPVDVASVAAEVRRLHATRTA